MNNRLIYILLLIFTINYCDDRDDKKNNFFVAAVVNRVNKTAKKVVYHKSPMEYRQAVERYMAVTKMNSIALDKRKMASYEVELDYLFNNYARFSTITLLARLCSAHQEMVKHITDVNSEKYHYYEQICSALLLQCAQMFSDNARQQLLDALHELDELIHYWRHQKNHPISYFFGKSPVKWVMGKNQEKEVHDNIKMLEMKQAELYIILGKLMTHVHSFVSCDSIYTACYDWIEELFEVLSCFKVDGEKITEKITDKTRFDVIAAQLECKIKQVSNLKDFSLHSISSTQKSNHFVRHWIAYTTMFVAATYITRYYMHNHGKVNQMFSDGCASLYNVLQGWVIEPSHNVWDIVFDKTTAFDLKTTALNIKNDIKILETKQGVNKQTSNNLNEVIKVDRTHTQQTMKYLLDKWVQDKKEFVSGIDKNGYNITYTIDADWCNKVIESEMAGDFTLFQKLVFDMPKGLINHLVRSDDVLDAIIVLAELKIYHYGSSIVVIILELLVDYGMYIAKEVLNVLAYGNPELGAKINLILNIAVLTPTVLGGWVGCNGLYKMYQRVTHRDYSPIRIALVEVNSLLIESPMPLDDYDYGKLVYLVYKLRDKSRLLKDALCNEFLADVTKLESKRFDVAAKRGIIDNMFNKYVFLGRIFG